MFDDGNIVFKSLIAYEAIVMLAPLPPLVPSLTIILLGTLPTELYAPFFHRTRDKGAANFHSSSAFASSTPVFALDVIIGAQPAG